MQCVASCIRRRNASQRLMRALSIERGWVLLNMAKCVSIFLPVPMIKTNTSRNLIGFDRFDMQGLFCADTLGTDF